MKRFEEFAKAYTEQFDNFQETNRQWLDRVKAETNLASEFLLEAHGSPFDSGRNNDCISRMEQQAT